MSISPTSGASVNTDPRFTNPTSIGGAKSGGMISTDFTGSFEEWRERTVRDMVRRYMAGEGQTSGMSDPSLGAPDPNAFGKGMDVPIPYSVWMFFEKYVDKFAKTDPWIQQNYGTPPERSAIYKPDPNSAAVLQDDAQAWNEAEAAKDRQNELDIVNIQEAGATGRVQMQIDASMKELLIQDATRRYIAEGEWGLQREITEANNKGAMDRLLVQIGFNEKELAQRALEEKNRYELGLKNLALEVAKYDAELAASPRNWFAYAAWLQNRNVAVTGESLAMAAQEVPESAIDPEMVAQTTGSALAGVQQQQAVQQPTQNQQMVNGMSGGSTSTQDAFGANTQPMTGQQQTPSNLTANTVGNALPQHTASATPEQIAQMTPEELQAYLLNRNPLAPTTGDVSQPNLQNIMNNLGTKGRVAGFGAYSGPTTNALGVEINEASGKDVDFRNFSKMTPSEQQAKFGGIESIRGPFGATDYIAEMERSRPKGGAAAGSAAYG